MSGLAEEAPSAYKDVDLVIESAVGAGLAKKVARLRAVDRNKGIEISLGCKLDLRKSTHVFE